MSKYDGIGLSDNVPSVTIFLPFFLSVELPYSVKRNEVLVQDIIVFNYLKKAQTVEVKVTKDAKFTAVDLTKYGWKGKELTKLIFDSYLHYYSSYRYHWILHTKYNNSRWTKHQTTICIKTKESWIYFIRSNCQGIIGW